MQQRKTADTAVVCELGCAEKEEPARYLGQISWPGLGREEANSLEIVRQPSIQLAYSKAIAEYTGIMLSQVLRKRKVNA